MINLSKCKDIAKALANQSEQKLGAENLNDFTDSFGKFITEYRNKYKFSSTSIELQKLESFFKWASEIIKDKDLLTPIIVNKMINDQDLYSLSLYQNFYAGTKLIPDIDNEYQKEYYENGGGENALALITGCHWIEQVDNSDSIE